MPLCLHQRLKASPSKDALCIWMKCKWLEPGNEDGLARHAANQTLALITRLLKIMLRDFHKLNVDALNSCRPKAKTSREEPGVQVNLLISAGAGKHLLHFKIKTCRLLADHEAQICFLWSSEKMISFLGFICMSTNWVCMQAPYCLYNTPDTPSLYTRKANKIAGICWVSVFVESERWRGGSLFNIIFDLICHNWSSRLLSGSNKLYWLTTFKLMY